MYRSLEAGATTVMAWGTLASTGANPLLWVLVAVAMLVIGRPSSSVVRGPGRR